jgi:hypothetical protein
MNIFKLLNSTKGILLSTALLLSVLAAFAGKPINVKGYPDWSISKTKIGSEEITIISVVELAKWIKNKHDDFLLIDAIAKKSYNEYTIPSAINYTDGFDNIETKIEKFIVYSNDDSLPAEIWTYLKDNFTAELLFLHGGMNEWIDVILFPDLTKIVTYSEEDRDRIKSTSLYFGGKPKVPVHSHPKRSGKYLREGC